jgi:parallel beta-helix repeat protein
MKTQPTFLLPFLTALPALVLQTSLLAQGSLTPPGAPAPTMKTLSQIEPRTPISSLPFTINTSGSYYVTTNLVGVPSSSGIFITASDVTIDLGGFTLFGATNGTIEYAISGSSGSNIVVTHGCIKNWPRSGINITSFKSCQIRDIIASSNGFSGIVAGDFSLVERCSSHHNGLNTSSQKGISVGVGCTVRDCIVSGENGPSSTAIASGGYCLVQRCTIQYNDSTNGAGIDPNGYSLVEDCLITQNQGGTNYTGIFASSYSRVRNCTVSANSGDGIRAVSGCSIIENDCSANGGNGIYVSGNNCRIDSNHLINNGDHGIRLASGNSCVVVRNTASGNATGDFPVAGSNIGPIQSPATATSPWANFSF